MHRTGGIGRGKCLKWLFLNILTLNLHTANWKNVDYFSKLSFFCVSESNHYPSRCKSHALVWLATTKTTKNVCVYLVKHQTRWIYARQDEMAWIAIVWTRHRREWNEKKNESTWSWMHLFNVDVIQTSDTERCKVKKTNKIYDWIGGKNIKQRIEPALWVKSIEASMIVIPSK